MFCSCEVINLSGLDRETRDEPARVVRSKEGILTGRGHHTESCRQRHQDASNTPKIRASKSMAELEGLLTTEDNRGQIRTDRRNLATFPKLNRDVGAVAEES